MNKNIGWECPKCGACYAPTVAKCETCVGVINAVGKPLPTMPDPFMFPPQIGDSGTIGIDRSPNASPGVYEVWLQRAAERVYFE